MRTHKLVSEDIFESQMPCMVDLERKAVVTSATRLRLNRNSTPIRLQFHRSTTIRRPTFLPVCGCCT